MKGVLKGAVVAALFAVAGNAAAQESDYAGMSMQAVEVIQRAPSVIPPGVELAAIERRLWVKDRYTDNLVYPASQIPMGKREKILGYISYVPFEGGHTLYQCYTTNNSNYFTSTDPGCEGRFSMPGRPIIGYIASTQLAGSVPLYRCFRNTNNWGDHFDTLDPGCEGMSHTQNDGVMGYIWL
jgi:hypothetical protein